MQANLAMTRATDWMRAKRWRGGLFVFAIGAFIATGQAPLGWAVVAFLGLMLLLHVLSALATSPRNAAALGWFAGTGYFAGSLNWIVEPFLVEPEIHAWLIPFAVLGLAGGLALFWALAAYLAQRFGGGALRLAITLAIAELARGYVFTGFPWALIGYIWVDTVFAQLAALIGPYGLTLVTLLLAALPACGLSKGASLSVWGAIAPVIGFGAVLWYGAVTVDARAVPATPTNAPMLRLVQPNAPQDQKWDPDMIPLFFNRMVDYSAADPKPDLILWPESSVPVLLVDAADTIGYISDKARQTPMVLGIQRSEDDDFFNSAVFVDKDGNAGQVYDKHHLVPFGEYMPFPEMWKRIGITGLAARVDTGYSAGAPPSLMNLGFATALPLICYEAVFPQYARITPRPDFLLQLTNDAWFGALTGPYQHLAQARMRAIETGLPMVRVANTGVSAVIGAKGEVLHSLPLNQEGFLDAPLPAAAPKTLYARIGDLPITLLLFFLSLAAIWPRWRDSD